MSVWRHSPLKLLIVAMAMTGVHSFEARAEVSNLSCDALAHGALPDANIVAAVEVAAGTYSPATFRPNIFPPYNLSGATVQGSNPAFCRVTFTMKPSNDSDIRSEIWLPKTGWNGKFLGIGSFGWGGFLMYSGMLSGLQQGYAVASNDTGHQDGTAKFAIGHPEKLIDYGYRANHEMTVVAKRIVHRFYGRAPSKSYWAGCSLGGLQGLIEAKRYPKDYDGIVAGAPPNPIVNFNALQLYASWLIQQDPSRMIPPDKYTMVHEAIIKACGSRVGQLDGVVDDPLACRFDPVVLQCQGTDRPDCLTAPQVYLLQQTYAGPTNPRTGAKIFVGPARGSELELSSFAKQQPSSVALDMFRYAALEDPSWTLDKMDWDKTITAATRKIQPLMHVDKDLRQFLAHGGKILFYVGGADYHNPADLAAYVDAVIKTAGAHARDSVRLFVIPGMGHCAGGAGCDTFDRLSLIDQWVENGKTPKSFVATKVDGDHVVRSRLICAYPATARYSNEGDVNSPSNFRCRSSQP